MDVCVATGGVGGLATTAAIGAVSVVAAKIGENGTSTTSTTTWKGNEGKERLDVENPNPGKRDDQIHYHEPDNTKHMFDFKNGQFENATKRLGSLLSDSKFVKGFNQALKILGIK